MSVPWAQQKSNHSLCPSLAVHSITDELHLLGPADFAKVLHLQHFGKFLELGQAEKKKDVTISAFGTLKKTATATCRDELLC